MNLSQHDITIRPHTHLANAVLVHNVVEFGDKKRGEAGNKEACLSLDQVVANCGVDLSEAAVENENQSWTRMQTCSHNIQWTMATQPLCSMRFRWWTPGPSGYHTERYPPLSGKM